MKTTYKYYIGALMLAALTGCSNDDALFFNTGEGRLALNTQFRSDVEVVSRAATGDAELDATKTVWIYSNKGVIAKYNAANPLPPELWLKSGKYTAVVWGGDSVSASFETRCFKGREEFTIKSGQTTPVNVVAKIANVVTSVIYTSAVSEVLDDVKLTIGHKRGELVFEGNDTRKGYFMMPSYDKNLKWKITATNKVNGQPFEKSGVIENVKPATEYVLRVDYKSADSDTGGGFFDIVIDENEIEFDDTQWLELPPIIRGLNFDIKEPVEAASGEVGRRSLFITASAEITSAVIASPGLSNLLGISGQTFDDFGFFKSTPELLSQIEAAGINHIYNYEEAEGYSSLKVNFEEIFTNSLPDGEYPFTVTLTDAAERVSSAVFTLSISSDKLKIDPVTPADVWSKSATITASVVSEGYGNAMFEYRKQGDAAWTQVAATAEARANILKAELTGLEQATTYEYRIIADDMESNMMTFTTESTDQLPNSGFESWNTNSTPYLVYAPGESMFWDCGNHGSATMSKNVTMPDETVRHSGNYSLKMASQFVGVGGALGKFAAGNVFVGQYLNTEGTDGVLGWGRPWTARPTALKVYVKYSPVTIDRTDGKNIPADVLATKGTMDKGIIYLAITDGTTESYTHPKSGEVYNFPFIAMTKTQKLFDKTAANVIAYGEKIFDATEGDGMIEFTIPVEYYRNDIKAANIIIVCSASKGGDYFVGGNGSNMWIDDLQLVYDK